jgi:hypothetical protein
MHVKRGNFLKENSAKNIGQNIPADNSWRIKTNEKLDKLTKRKKYIIREIISRRIAWLGHLERTEEHPLTKKIMEWSPQLLDREEDVKLDLKL